MFSKMCQQFSVKSQDYSLGRPFTLGTSGEPAGFVSAVTDNGCRITVTLFRPVCFGSLNADLRDDIEVLKEGWDASDIMNLLWDVVGCENRYRGYWVKLFCSRTGLYDQPEPVKDDKPKGMKTFLMALPVGVLDDLSVMVIRNGVTVLAARFDKNGQPANISHCEDVISAKGWEVDTSGSVASTMAIIDSNGKNKINSVRLTLSSGEFLPSDIFHWQCLRALHVASNVTGADDLKTQIRSNSMLQADYFTS